MPTPPTRFMSDCHGHYIYHTRVGAHLIFITSVWTPQDLSAIHLSAQCTWLETAPRWDPQPIPRGNSDYMMNM